VIFIPISNVLSVGTLTLIVLKTLLYVLLSVVCTSGCKYWKVNFDPDDKDNTYMTLTQSSKEQFLDECNSLDECLTENEDMVSIIFYYIVKTKIYSVAVVRD